MEKYVHIADEGAMIVMGRYEQSQQEQSAYQSEQALEERNLCQKQYDYYREKLLTFE